MTAPAMRRYVAEIYRLQQDLPKVGPSELAGAMGASLQATSRMVGRREHVLGFDLAAALFVEPLSSLMAGAE